MVTLVVLEVVSSIASISSRDRKRLLSAFSASCMYLYVVFHINSLVWAALWWVILIFNARIVLMTLVRMVSDLMVLPRLMQSYQKNEFPSLGFPLVYVLNEPGLNPYYSQRFARELFLALSKLKITLSPVLSTAVLEKPAEFQKWLVAEAAALIVICRLKDDADPAFPQMVAEYSALCLGPISFIYIKPEKLKAVFISEYVDPSEVSARFEGETTLFEEIKTRPIEELTRKFDGLSGSAVKFVDRLNSTIIPTSQSDSALPADLRNMVSNLAYYGLPPVAGCYLRFRLAHSDVERYLCLLDCVEVLVKFSAITLLADMWENDVELPSEFNSKLTRPTLGVWIDMLRTLLGYSVASELTGSIRQFWQKSLRDAPKQLIDEAAGSGLAWNGKVPRSHLIWLDWFVWLRNTTRGHGSIEEGMAEKLWQGFHETFLRMVLDLKELVLFRSLESYPVDGETIRFQGWRRGNSTFDDCGDTATSCLFLSPNNAAPTSDGPSSAAILLHPLVINLSGSFLLWNTVREGAIEYIDYASGQLTRLTFPETDPHNLWKRSVRLLLEAETPD